MDTNITSQVSWQSAFWGLLPIALNSMAQPSGKVCDSPAGIGFMLRISPVMCLLDALVVVVRSIVYSFPWLSMASFRAANKKIILQRYTDDDDNSGMFKDFRENRVTRVVMFILFMLQIVKLFAFQGPGVLATQVCAGIFLGSAVVVELLVVFPKAYTSIDGIESTNRVTLPYSTVGASTCFMLYTIVNALRPLIETYGLTWNALKLTGLTILFCESVAFVPSGLHSHLVRLGNQPVVSQKAALVAASQNLNERNDTKPRNSPLEDSQPQVPRKVFLRATSQIINETNDANPRNQLLGDIQPHVPTKGFLGGGCQNVHETNKTQEVIPGTTRQNSNETNAAKPRKQLLVPNILLLLIHAIPAAYFLLSHLLPPARRGQHSLDTVTGNIVASIMIGIWAILCVSWAVVNFKAVLDSGREKARQVENMLSWYFCILHFIAAVLYYKYVYDPTGTVKPGWTEQLG